MVEKPIYLDGAIHSNYIFLFIYYLYKVVGQLEENGSMAVQVSRQMYSRDFKEWIHHKNIEIVACLQRRCHCAFILFGF